MYDRTFEHPYFFAWTITNYVVYARRDNLLLYAHMNVRMRTVSDLEYLARFRLWETLRGRRDGRTCRACSVRRHKSLLRRFRGGVGCCAGNTILVALGMALGIHVCLKSDPSIKSVTKYSSRLIDLIK
jgi:hypothetical protein